MSAAEIMKQIPRLTDTERRAIRQMLLDLANQDADVASCNQAALEGALIFDRTEDEDVQRNSR